MIDRKSKNVLTKHTNLNPNYINIKHGALREPISLQFAEGHLQTTDV